MVYNGIVDGLTAIVPKDRDIYIGDDGIEYCTRCNTARQARVELFGKVRVVPCICKCMVAEMEAQREADRQRELEDKLARYRALGFPDAELKGCTFAVDDGSLPQITNAMKAYVENFHKLRVEGKGLLLWGDVGTGKTFFSACVVNALIDKGYPCLMTNFSRLTNQLAGKWEDKQDYIDSLSRFALVALDDLGVERDTAYMNENVTTIIDALYRSKTPVIITSNYTPRQLSEAEEIRKRRVYDRLLERCHPVKVNTPSKRKQQGRTGYNEMQKLLGL